MRGMRKFFALAGRVLLSSIFLLSAIHRIFTWQQTQTALINTFCDWQAYIGFFPSVAKFFSNLIAWVPEILIVFTIIELIASIFIFFGYREKLGVVLLIILFIPSNVLLHPFWFLTGVKRSIEMLVFLKNLSILGGLFLLGVFGSRTSDGMMFSSMKSDCIDEN